MKKPKKIVFATTEESSRLEREIQLLKNVVEPDPEYQAFFLSDEASLLEISGTPLGRIQARLEAYFLEPLPFDVRTPLPELVDLLKGRYPTWPEEWPPNDS